MSTALIWTYIKFTYRRPTKVIGACSFENNALKTKSRTIYANFRNVAQNLARSWHISSLLSAENFV